MVKQFVVCNVYQFFSSQLWACDGYNPDRNRSVVLPLVVGLLLRQIPTRQAMRTVISRPRLTCRLGVKPRHTGRVLATLWWRIMNEHTSWWHCCRAHSLTDNLPDMVTPSTFKDLTRAISVSVGGSIWWRTSLSAVWEDNLCRFGSVEHQVVPFDHPHIWSNSCWRLSTLHAGMIT